ncbi:membrane protein [Mycolicibacterium insubricum]|nr:membrane protein [Mycolicibacterium insubricum]
MSEKTRSLLGYAGVAMAAAGVSHFVKPGIYQPVTTAAFPENTRRHVYTNGGIETALGLALIAPRTRKVGLAGVVAYLAYLGGNVIRRRG